MKQKTKVIISVFTVICIVLISLASCNKTAENETTTTSSTVTNMETPINITTSSDENASKNTSRYENTETSVINWIQPLTAEYVCLFNSKQAGTLIISDGGNFTYTNSRMTVTGWCIYEDWSNLDYKIYWFYIGDVENSIAVYAYNVYEADNGYRFEYRDRMFKPIIK